MGVRKDGKLLAFLNRKSWSLFQQKIKAQRLTWTQAWRRRNKKGKVEEASRRRVKKAAKTYKTVVGLSMEDIRKRRTQKPEMRKAQREAALREIKECKKSSKDAKKKANYAKGAPRKAGSKGNAKR